MRRTRWGTWASACPTRGSCWPAALATWQSSRGSQDRRTESYVVPLCSGLFRGQRTAYGVNWHGVLNVAGMIPGVGPWADLANAGPCAWEGDWLGAGQSLWSALPGIGDAFQGTKVATGASKFASHGDDLARVGARAGSHADEVADAARAAGKAGDVAKAAGRVTNSPKAVRKFWNSLEKVGKGLRKEGKGRKAVYYVIDYLHNEFEKYDHKGDHLGAVDPNTGETYKPPVPGRNIRDRL